MDSVSNKIKVKEYQPRPGCLKESENPYTLKSRKYVHNSIDYYRSHAQEIRQKTREMYNTNLDYRLRCIQRAQASYLRRKEQNAINYSE